MNIEIEKSELKFMNPQRGHPTRAVKEHFYKRRIRATVDGEEQTFSFTPEELDFGATEDDMVRAIENQLSTKA